MPYFIEHKAVKMRKKGYEKWESKINFYNACNFGDVLIKRTGSGYVSMTHPTFQILQYFACTYVIVADETTNTT
jgi:hypothetical protein